MRFDALKECYLAAQALASARELSGPFEGEILRARSIGLLPLALTRLGLLAWVGKTFVPQSDETGSGFNHIKLPIRGRTNALPFRAHLGPSRIDGKQSLIVEYDLPENPQPSRVLFDEIRGLGSGLYLGAGLRNIKPSPVIDLWFTLHGGTAVDKR